MHPPGYLAVAMDTEHSTSAVSYVWESLARLMSTMAQHSLACRKKKLARPKQAVFSSEETEDTGVTVAFGIQGRGLVS